MPFLTSRNIALLGSLAAMLSACAQSPNGSSRYGSEPEIVSVCCAPTPPPCGVYAPCAPPVVLRPAPPVIEYVPEPEPVIEAPVYVPPAPEPEIYIPPAPEPLPPVYTPPAQAWPEPATPPPVWVPRK